MDKTTETLIEALKEALARPEEQPLYKIGKQPGLFPSRTGLYADAAQRALQHGLLEIVRSEIKGKAESDWVRITTRGVQFVYQHESPKAVLEELVNTLRPNQHGVPRWIEDLQAHLQTLTQGFTELLERQAHYLDHLAKRAEEALRRLTAGVDPASLELWQLDALDYLDRRKAVPRPDDCSLPELFHHLEEKHAGLKVTAFHDGLAHLRDRGALELVAYGGHLSELAEPEYALLEGAAVYYTVRRT